MRAGRREIVLPPPGQAKPTAEPNPSLVQALARAYRWQRMLDSGQAAGVEEIAAQYGVNRTYVARMLPLTMLAPDVVDDILKGTEPSGLSLRALSAEPLPTRWDEQRTALSTR